MTMGRLSQSPVATTQAFSIISTALRIGTTGRCSMPAGTVKACRGLESTTAGTKVTLAMTPSMVSP
jgi:hypothetical protein